MPSPENTHFLFLPLLTLSQGPWTIGEEGERAAGTAGRKGWGLSHAPLPTSVLFFIGSEESAVRSTGQFGSNQGSSGRLLRCQPCAEGCTSCLDATPCLAEEAPVLRAAVLSCQTCCMLAVFLSMLASYRCRQSKARKAPHLSSAHVSYPSWVSGITRDQRLPRTRTWEKMVWS